MMNALAVPNRTDKEVFDKTTENLYSYLHKNDVVCA